MVRARLHVICGNCGCADMLSFEIERDGCDITTGDTSEFLDDAYIHCDNCSTLHSLDSTLPRRKEVNEDPES